MSSMTSRYVSRAFSNPILQHVRHMADEVSVTFRVIGPDKFSQTIKTVAGRPLFKVFQQHKIDYLPCVCNGQLSCTTCHVKFDDETLLRLPKPSLAEMDMLDIAGSVDDFSRLSCQLVVSRVLEGCIIDIPDKVINHMDDPSGTSIPTRLLKK